MAAESSVKWTKEQRAGIETTGVNLLISAAAGSGKTAVLAERCAYLVCDAPQPCDVDQLLVVTFTEAAAAEMKGRIETALRKRLESRPDDDRLRAQIAQIDRAQVSTLHGFCSRLLRQHFHLLGLDPNFDILDGDEARLLRLEVVRDLFADRYETDSGGLFQKFIDVYGDGDDDSLQIHVIRTHELLCSIVDREQWIADARARILDGINKPLRECAMGKELARIIKRRLALLSDRCAQAVDTVSRLDGFGKIASHLGGIGVEIVGWKAAFGDDAFDALAKRVDAFEFPRKPTIRDAPPGKASADAAVDSVKDEMGKDGSLYPLLRFSAEEWSAGLRSIAPFAELFLDLVEEFSKRFDAAKEKIRRIDFSDLERLALQVLRRNEDGEWVPSSVAKSLRRQIQHVLVDEYQDINGVQDAILSLVSRAAVEQAVGSALADGTVHRGALSSAKELGNQSGGMGYQPMFSIQKHGLVAHATNSFPSSKADPTKTPNLFCVGDVKQSIYGFRLAEPARFLERYDRYKTAKNGDGRVIDLQANFRSRAPLLEALNGLFERLMTREVADISYDESHKLRPGANYPPAGPSFFTGAPIELHLLPGKMQYADPDAEDEIDAGAELDRTEREAAFVASRIHELMGHDGRPPMQVIDRDVTGAMSPRPLKFRDIVILLRSVQFKSEQFARVLRQHEIRTHRVSGTGYFESLEVRDMLALLNLLDNAQQDLPLAAMLRSPILRVAAPEDSLARIRLAYRDAAAPIPFHDAVRRYAGEQQDELATKLREVLAQLARWRQISRQRPLAELIWHIYEETGYLAFCNGLDDGEQRCANLMYLHEKAAQFGSFSRQGLYRFLRFLDGLRDDADLGVPSVLGEGEDVVRIMSVHKSKGLEFPVVFLPDLGKKINMESAGGSLVVDRAAYLGLAAIDEEKQVRYPSLAQVLVTERLKQQTKAEELRVLYVAATRAKEHLILVGTIDAKNSALWPTLYGHHRGPLPAEMVLEASTMLDWIGPAAAAMHGAGLDAIEVIQHDAEEVAGWSVPRAASLDFTPRQAGLAALKPLSPPPPANAAADEVIRRLQVTYSAEPFTRVRAALAVTEWAKMQKSHAGDAASPVFVDRLLALPRSLAGVLPMAANDRGTATHLVLEHLDFGRSCRGDDLRGQIEKMLHRKLISGAEANAVDQASIEWFIESDLGKLIRSLPPEDVIREIPFNLALSPQGLFGTPPPPSPADRVMLRGRIDLLLRHDGKYTIVDYKTDNVSGEQIELRKDSYRPQVQLYREALQRIAGVEVAGVFLVFLSPRIVCEM